jgi:hypothetical protein
MKKKPITPARLDPGDTFVKLKRDLLRSDAWRSQSINTRRFIDFLCLEHLSKGGAENGALLAPYDQLETIGIPSRLVSSAIRGAEELGLVECTRQGLKVVTLYRLTWIDAHGRPATNEWRAYQNPALRQWPVPKIKNQPSQVKVYQPSQVKADAVYQPSQVKADRPKRRPSQVRDLSRCSYQDGKDYSDLTVGLAPGVHVDAAGAVWRATQAEWLPVQGHRLRVVTGARP